MKKVLLLVAVAISVASCSVTKITSTHTDVGVYTPVTAPVIADLDVSAKKIKYEYEPGSAIRRGGSDNVINAAVSKALLQNGNADVLVGLETHTEYSSTGAIDRIIVTGYPAYYKNFRNATSEDLLRTNQCTPMEKKPAGFIKRLKRK